MPDPSLQGTALRYAAGDLPPVEAAAFEARLAADQDARDALAEAVRLSAAALGQEPPAPHPVVRDVVRARVGLRSVLWQPFAWGGVVAAGGLLVWLALTDRDRAPAAQALPVVGVVPAPLTPPEQAPPPRPVEPAPVAVVPAPHDAEEDHAAADAPRTVAEIWADLSTPDHLEKARDEDLRWRHRVREMTQPPHHPGHARPSGGGTNVRD